MISSWDLHGLTIALVEVSESHTGEYISRKLLEVFEQFDLTKKMAAIITDNASNAIASSTLAATELRKQSGQVVLSLRCVPHILNLVVNAGFTAIDGPLHRLKTVVNTVRRSIPVAEKLSRSCTYTQEKFRYPKTDVETRWNSTLLMIESMLPMQQAVMLTFNDGPILPGDWVILRRMVDLLKPFEEATEILSGSNYCTLSKASFLATELMAHLKENQNDTVLGVPEMIAKLADYIHEIEGQSLLATFLDPCMVDTMDPKDQKRAINILKPKIKQQAASEPPAKKPCFFEKGMESQSLVDSRVADCPELARYVNSPKPHWKSDPLSWWRENEKHFPVVADLARTELAMLASSVPSEQTFSRAGLIVTDLRNRLSTLTVEHLIVLESWRRWQRKEE